MKYLANLTSIVSGPKFSPQSLVRACEITLVILLAISLANFGWSLLPGPVGSDVDMTELREQQAMSNSSAFVSGNLATPALLSPLVKGMFGSVSESSGQSQAIATENIQQTQLNLTLKGILSNDSTAKHFALIARGSQKEEVYRVGDTIEGAEILQIESRRVLIRRNGVTEALNLEVKAGQPRNASVTAAPVTMPGLNRGASLGVSGDRSGIRMISDTQRVVSQDTLRQQLQNLPQLLTQAKAVPHMENGQSVGFRVTEIQPDSVFQQLGLEREDVIRAVNGSPVRSVDDAIKAYGNMKTATSFQLDLLRRGQPVTINFSVQ